MKLLFAFFSFFPLISFSQPYEKSYVDTAIQHQWELSDPAMLKMLTSSGEPYLRNVVTFGDRRKFGNGGGNGNLEWSFNAATQELEVADMEELTVMSYTVKKLDAELLILQVGKQEIIFRRKQ